MTRDKSRHASARCKRLLAALLLAACLVPLPAAEHPYVAAAWSVQQEADQLTDALRRRPRELGPLLIRVRRYLEQHGEALVRSHQTTVLRPANEVFARLLAEGGYQADFIARFGDEAEQELAACDPTDRQALTAIATGYPLTEAAGRAWSTLANLAWDRGRLGDFRALARRCPQAPGIAARLQLTDDLQRGRQPPDELGVELERFSVMWQTAFQHTTGRRTIHGHYLDDREPAVAMLAVDANTLAVNSGRYAFLCNPLTGARLGPVHRLGTDTLAPAWAAPAHDREHVVLLGRSGVFHTITCLDRAGHQLWRSNADGLGHQTACSNPVIADHTVVVCSVGSDDNGITIRANGFDIHSGQARWSTQIAKVPGRQLRRSITAPMASVIEGQILIASQHGFLALLTPSGRLLHLVGYPRQGEAALREALRGFGRQPQQPRQPRLLTVGSRAILAGDDHQDLLIYDHQRGAVAVYRGDGSDGRPLAGDQRGVLLSGQLLRLLDPVSGRLLWEAVAPDGREITWATLNGDRVLAATESVVFLLDADSGRLLASSSDWPGGRVLGLQSGVLVGYADGRLRGFGAADELHRSLQRRIAEQPDDPRPLLAMAALLQARRQPLVAFDHLIRAIDRGAPAGTVDRALAVLRPQLQLQIGSPQGEQVLAALARLAKRAEAVASELAWWRGRHAELLGDAATARRLWSAIPTDLDRSIEGDGGSIIRLGFAAQMARARLDGELGPLTPLQSGQRATLSVSDPAWRRPYRGHGRLLRQGERWYWYCEGMVRGIAIADGDIVWRQQGHDGDRPMLGIYLHNPDSGQDGVPVTVIPGSSAYRAGIRSDDQILSINGESVVTGRDVQALVRELPIGSDFTATVHRDDTVVSCEGELGSWPEEPCAANERYLVTRSLTIERGRDGFFEANPDTMRNPHIRVYRIADGSLVWSRTLAIRQEAWPPLLTRDDLLLLADNNGLQAWDLSTPEPLLRWELPGQGYELRHARQVGRQQLLVLDEVHERIVLRNLRDGGTDFSTPWHPSFQPLLTGGDLLVTDPDRQLLRIDLGTARERWRLQSEGHRPVAVTETLVYTIDREQSLHSWHRRNGLPHRRYRQLQRVLDWRLADDLLYVYGVDERGTDSWGALHLENGTIAWRQSLPDSLELQQQLEVDETGVVGLFIDEYDRHVAVVAQPDGRLRSVTVLDRNEQLLTAAGFLFAYSPDHIRHLPDRPPGDNGALPAQRLAALDLGGWQEQLQAGLAATEPSHTRGGEVASVVAGDYLGLLITPDQRQTTALRLSRELAPLMPADGLIVLRPGREPVQTGGDQTWSMVGHEQLDDGRVLILVAGHGQLLSRPWYLNYSPIRDIKHPWWLRGNWYRLTPQLPVEKDSNP